MKNQSLEDIVVTHFPLIIDKFNFTTGTLKGISFGFSMTHYSAILHIYQPVSPTGKSTTYKTKKIALDKYRKFVTKYLSEYINNTHFETLYNKLIENIIPKIEKTLESRENAINKLCEFTHTRFKKIERHEYTRLFNDNSNDICRITYASPDKAKCKPKYICVKHNKINIAVTKANIPLIMKDIEENLIINERQRDAILKQLDFLSGPSNESDVYTNIITQSKSFTISSDELGCIKKGLEAALEFRTKHIVDNSLTKEEKWKKHCLDTNIYDAWLTINAIQNKG